MDESEAERQKKLKAGRLKLEKFKKRKNKAAAGNKTQSPSSTSSSVSELSIGDYQESTELKNENREIELPSHNKQSGIASQAMASQSQVFEVDDKPIRKPIECNEYEDNLSDLKQCGENIRKMQEKITKQEQVITELGSRLDEKLKTIEEREAQYEKMVSVVEDQRQQVANIQKVVEKVKQEKNELVLQLEKTRSRRATCDVSVETNEIPDISVKEPVPIKYCDVNIQVENGDFTRHFDCQTSGDLHNKHSHSDRNIPHICPILSNERDKCENPLLHSVDNHHEDREIPGRSSVVNSLERIICINNIAKTINHLLLCVSVSSLDQSSCHLSCVNSEDGTARNIESRQCIQVPVAHEMDDYFQVPRHTNELLLKEDFSDNLTSIMDFLKVEMGRSCMQFSSDLDASRSIEQARTANGDESKDTVSGDDISIINFQVTSQLAAQEQSSFDDNILCLSDWVNNIQDHTSRQFNVSGMNISSPVVADTMISDEQPPSNVSLVSLTDSERFCSAATQWEDDPFDDRGTDDIKTVSSHLYTIHEESNEDAIVTSKYGQCIAELKSQHAKEIDELKNYLENDYKHEKKELLAKICHLEGENHSSQVFAVRLQSDLMVKLNSVKDVTDVNYKKLEDTLQVKMKQMDQVLSQFNSVKEVVRRRHKQDLATLRSEMEAALSSEKANVLAVEKELKISKAIISEIEQEKLKMHSDLSNQIADLVAEHDLDMENTRQNLYVSYEERKKLIEKEHLGEMENLKQKHIYEIREMEHKINLCIASEAQKATEQHNNIRSSLVNEISELKRKVENLMEEKCQSLEKSRKSYEQFVKQNQNSLYELCKHFESLICCGKTKIECRKSADVSMEETFVETLDELSQEIKTGIDIFLKKKPVVACAIDVDDDADLIPMRDVDSSTINHDRPDVISFELHMLRVKKMEQITNDLKESYQHEINKLKEQLCKHEKESVLPALDSTKMLEVMEGINQMKYEFEDELTKYKLENEKLGNQLQNVTKKLNFFEEKNIKLNNELWEAGTKLHENCAKSDCPAVSNLIQTNTRLLNVLSDVVKTLVDIERDINMKLREYGLGTSHSSEGLLHHDDDTGQNVGSREDFTGLGDNANLELHEDGPDLTPRTWSIVKSMGEYDADAEGEDVVIGSSRRVRSQVDHILQLLSLVFDKTKEQDFRALLKQNEELSQDLQEESYVRDDVQMQLLDAQSTVRKLESEKHKLEDENFHLSSDKDTLSETISSLKLKLCRLEDDKDRTYDEKKQLQGQLELLSSRLGDPEKTAACNDNSSQHVAELLEENTKLSSEKLSIQKNLSKERQTLAARVQQLELSLEEMAAQKDDIIEKARREIAEKKDMFEFAEKQIVSYKKFIDEQALEREQEREELYKEVNKARDRMREKDKIQIMESQRTKETENLERQLKTKIEEHGLMVAKKGETERELQQSLDKIHDLREVIAELEKQLETKSRMEMELKTKLGNALKSLSVHEERNESLKHRLEERSNSFEQGESDEKLKSLEEQLASKSQELEQMNQSEMLLRELRGQIHFLEAKVDQKIRQVQSMNLVLITESPVLSDDASHTGSQDGEHYPVQYEDGWEMSPRSIHWLEIRRLEEKICRLLKITEELVKQNNDNVSQLKKLQKSENDLRHESLTLHNQCMEQYVQISALTSQIDELRHRVQMPVNTPAITEIEKLRELLENEQEQRKRSSHDISDLKEKIHELELSLQNKNKLIERLREVPESSHLRFSKATQAELYNPLFQVAATATANSESYLPSLWQKLLLEKTSEIDMLQKQVTNLQEQIEQSPMSSKPVSGDIKAPGEEPAELKKMLSEKESELLSLKEEKSSYMKRLLELEDTVRQNVAEKELEQVQLEKDFDTVHVMMEQKEKELSTLQEETESQLRLESTVDTLQQQFEEQKLLRAELEEKMMMLSEELDSTKMSHDRDIENWKKKNAEIVKQYECRLEVLENQVSVLKNEAFLPGREDIDIKEIQEKITSAAKKLKDFGEESETLFKQMTYNFLFQAVEKRARALSAQHEVQLEAVHKSWCGKLEETSHQLKKIEQEHSRRELEVSKRKFNEEKGELKKQFDKDLSELSKQKDLVWKEKMSQLESSLQKAREKISKLLRKESQYRDGDGKNIEEVKKALQNGHKEEIAKLKNEIEKITKDKENDVDLLRSRYEREKVVLLKECEEQYSGMSQQMKTTFEKERADLESMYEKKMEEMRSAVEKEHQEFEDKRQSELQAIHAAFEKKWDEKAEMFRQFHKDEIQTFRDSKEKDTEALCQQLFTAYDNKLKAIQAECEEQLIAQKKSEAAELESAMQKCRLEMQEEFDREKLSIIEQRELAVRAEFEQRYDRGQLEKLESAGLQNLEKQAKLLEENWTKKMSSREKKLRQSCQMEVNSVKECYETKLEQLRKEHEDELRTIHKQMKSANDLVKAFKSSFASFSRTPLSDATSSDETSDMSSPDDAKLIQKIHAYGMQALSMIKNAPDASCEAAELRLLQEERDWAIARMYSVLRNLESRELDFRCLLDKLIKEYEFGKKSLQKFAKHNISQDQQIWQLQQQLNSSNGELMQKLHQQMEVNSHLEAALQSNGVSLNVSNDKLERNGTSFSNEGIPSIEVLRSASTHRSGNFSMNVPAINDDTPLWVKGVNQSKVFSTPVVVLDSVSNFEDEYRTDEYRTSLVKVVTPKRSGIDQSASAKLNSINLKYYRCQKFRKALIFQKNYLAKVLSSFQKTEDMVIAMLTNMGYFISPKKDSCSSFICGVGERPRGASLFRSCAYALIALSRMKFLVKQWQKTVTAYSSSSKTFSLNTDSSYRTLRINTNTGISIHSNSSTSLSSPSVDDGRSEWLSNRSSLRNSSTYLNHAEKGQEYINRLEFLHRQLGLSESDKS